MQRTLKIIGFCLLLLLAPAFASAYDLTDGLISLYEMSDTSDSHGSNTLTNSGVGFSSGAGVTDNYGTFTSGQSDYMTALTGAVDEVKTISFWFKTSGNNYLISTDQSNTDDGHFYSFLSGGGNLGKFGTVMGAGTAVVSSSTYDDGNWHLAVLVLDETANEVYYYIDNSLDGTQTNAGDTDGIGNGLYNFGRAKDTTTWYYSATTTYQSQTGFWNRSLNSTERTALYNSGSGLSYNDFSEATPPGEASERLEQTSYLEQSSNVSINNVVYSTVLSGSVEITDNAELFATATVPLLATGNNQADCRMTFDGTEMTNSETSRTLSTGSIANVLMHSSLVSETPGNYTLNLECKRTGGGSFTVFNSNVVLHSLTTTDGVQLVSNETNITSNAISGLVDSFKITTSENQTATGETRAVVLSWSAEYDYTSTQNMSVTTEVAGTNCSSVNRYGSSGSRGSVGSICFTDGLTNSTEYDVNIYGTGTGNLENAVFVAREVILHTNELNTTDLAGVNVTSSSYADLTEHNITVNAGHSSPNLLTQVAVAVLSNNGSTTSSFYASDGTTNSSTVSRTATEGQPGILGIQLLSQSVSGVVTLSLAGLCSNANCSLDGVEMVSYLTDDNPAEPNNFYVFVNNTYTGSLVNTYDFSIGNTTYSTSSGIVEVFTEDSLVNITFPATNSTTMPFFPNNTLNHDTNNNLTIVGRPWTSVYALEPDSSTVYNYTINYTNLNDSSENGSWTTTSGVAYVPLTNATYNLSITGAVGNDSTNFAVQTQTVNVSPYLENYTFNLLVANSVNISYYDEETSQLIDDRTVILDYFSNTGTSGNDSTTTGVMFVNLLLPEAYTFIYDADGYDQRFFEYILVNETFNNINLTLLNSSSSSTVTITVKDTLDNLLEDAKVKILKFDISENEYDLLEVRRTNFEGQTIAGMILNEPLYKFIIEYNGEVVLTTSGTQIYGTDLTLVVNLIQTSGFEEVFAGYSMSGAVTFDNATNLFTYNFNDESNTGSSACLRVYRVGSSRTNYNASCTSSPSGTIILGVENISGRSYQAIGTIIDSSGYTHTIDSAWAVFQERIADTGGSLIMMILMIIIFATALAVSVEIALVTAFAVPVIFTATGLTALSYSVTVPLLLVGVILAFILGVIKK